MVNGTEKTAIYTLKIYILSSLNTKNCKKRFEAKCMSLRCFICDFNVNHYRKIASIPRFGNIPCM